VQLLEVLFSYPIRAT